MVARLTALCVLLMVVAGCAVSPVAPGAPKRMSSSVSRNAVPAPYVWFMAVRAKDRFGQFSDYSQEAIAGSANSNAVAEVGWLPSEGASGYQVSWGTNSGNYTSAKSAGTNLSAVINLGTRPETRVVILTAICSSNLAGPWVPFAAWPEQRFTNTTDLLYVKTATVLTNY